MWVCLSDVFDVKDTVKAIIISATGVCDLPTMELLQGRLRVLLFGKIYLLILDNVWNVGPTKWEDLKSLLGCGGHGSRVIVTTCSDKVSSIVGTLPTYHLACLSEDGSWILFKQKAFDRVNEELVDIGKAIVRKCGGLPLAIKVLGSSMRHKERDRGVWLDVVNSDIWNIKS